MSAPPRGRFRARVAERGIDRDRAEESNALQSRNRPQYPVRVRAVRCTVAIAAIAALAVLPPRSAAAGDLLELTLHHEAERAGDYDALASAWIDALPSFADDPRGDFIARRLASIASRLARPGAIVPGLERLRADERVAGPSRVMVATLLSAARRRAGDEDGALALLDESGLVRTFAAVGPFGKDGAATLATRFPPEDRLDLDATYRDGFQTLAWRAVTLRDDDLDVDRHTWPRRGFVYALAQVRADGARDALLHVGSGRDVRVWLNGTLVIDDTVRSVFLSSHRQALVRLAPGWNRVLVKTEGRVALRVTDPRGRTFAPEVLETLRFAPGAAPALEPIEPDAGALVADATVDVLARAPERWAAALAPADASAGTSSALEALGLALLWSYDGRDELAVEAASRAAALAPDDPFVRYHAGSVLRGAGYLPSAQAKSRAKDNWEAAIRLEPGFLPAREQLARLLVEDQKHDEALAMLDGALARRPDFLDGLVRLHAVYSARGWDVEARRTLRRIAELAPELPWVDVMLGRWYDERENPAKALEHYLVAFEKDRAQTALLSSIASRQRDLGHVEDAERTLRARLASSPDDSDAVARLARFLVEAGRADEAVAVAEQHAAARGWDPDAHETLAEVLASAERDVDLLAAWRRVLEIAPGDVGIRDALHAREHPESFGRDLDAFWTPWDESLDDWIARVPADGPLVEKAAALSVLDITVVEVLVDGSTREYTHQAFRLLSEEAKESLAKVETPGEVVRLRTLTTDGRSLEPVAALGRSSYVLPGLEPGVFTEYAYRVDRAGAAGAPFRHGSFFFQDYRFQQSFLLSRIVFLLPPDIPSDIVETALPRGADPAGRARVERTERELPDGRLVVMYEARNVPRLEPERAMPPYAEYLPSVEVTPRRSWAEVETRLRQSVDSATLRTPEITSLARELTAGIERPLEKARALHDHVHELIADESGARDAVRVLLEKSGDRTTLFKALLDAAGVPSSWAFVREHESLASPVDWAHPSPSHFPWRFVLIEAAGEEPVWTTLRFRRLPFGHLPERFGDGRALVLRERGAELVTLPPVAAARYVTSSDATLRLGDSDSADVELSVSSGALESRVAKDQIRNLPAFQKNLVLRAQVNQLFPGAQVKTAEFRGLDDTGSGLVFAWQFTAPKLLAASGDDLLLAPVVKPGQFVRSYGAPAERKHPYVLRGQRVQHDRVRVEIGASLRVARLPADVVAAGATASYSLSYRRDGDALVVERCFEMRPGRLEPAEFPAFLDLLRAADAAESERILLRRVAPSGP